LIRDPPIIQIQPCKYIGVKFFEGSQRIPDYKIKNKNKKIKKHNFDDFLSKMMVYLLIL